MELNKTIAALSSGKGNAALAIIRISGENCFNIVRTMVKQEIRFLKAKANENRLYSLINSQTKKAIDESMIVKYFAPKSYTGENMVEIACHGGEIVIEEILSALVNEKVSIADRGEFTRRAYLNGKMELLKAEYIDQIIQSKSKIQHNIALNAFHGNGTKKIYEWKEKLKNIIVELEAKIEFPDEDDIVGISDKTIDKIFEIQKEIKNEIKNREKVEYIEKGLTIPIVGIANAGKSTLFNLLLGFDRAIVNSEAGTTRDSISEEMIISGDKIKIFDTAGLNTTENEIEKIGIKKSLELIANSTMLLWVTPADKEITDYEKKIIENLNKKCILGIISKKDLKKDEHKNEYLKQHNIHYFEVSLIKKEDQEKVLFFIKEQIENEMKEINVESGIICNKRQKVICMRIVEKIGEIIKVGEKAGDEIISYKVSEILKDIAELVGEVTSEDILNSIFSNFCIGK